VISVREAGKENVMRTLTLAEAAAVLNTTEETVSAMIRREGLPAAKVGRAYVLVDVDVIEWLRTRYAPDREIPCDSTGVANVALGGLTSGTPVGALDAALARPTAKRRKNGPTESKPSSGAVTDSDNVLPLHGIPPS
jgi:excisionase family DNA binding protein